MTHKLALAYSKQSNQPTHLPDFLFLNNRQFYQDLNSLAFLRDIGKHFRVSTMLSRDSVKSRMAQSGPHNEES